MCATVQCRSRMVNPFFLGSCFKQDSKKSDDKELQALDREEIINLSCDGFLDGSSTGESAGSFIVKHTSATGPRSAGNSTSVGHVQSRVWAGQVSEPCHNIDVGDNDRRKVWYESKGKLSTQDKPPPLLDGIRSRFYRQREEECRRRSTRVWNDLDIFPKAPFCCVCTPAPLV